MTVAEWYATAVVDDGRAWLVDAQGRIPSPCGHRWLVCVRERGRVVFRLCGEEAEGMRTMAATDLIDPLLRRHAEYRGRQRRRTHTLVPVARVMARHARGESHAQIARALHISVSSITAVIAHQLRQPR